MIIIYSSSTALLIVIFSLEINGKNKYYKFKDHTENPKYGYRLFSIGNEFSKEKHEDITTKKDNSKLRKDEYTISPNQRAIKAMSY